MEGNWRKMVQTWGEHAGRMASGTKHEHYWTGLRLDWAKLAAGQEACDQSLGAMSDVLPSLMCSVQLDVGFPSKIRWGVDLSMEQHGQLLLRCLCNALLCFWRSASRGISEWTAAAINSSKPQRSDPLLLTHFTGSPPVSQKVPSP